MSATSSVPPNTSQPARFHLPDGIEFPGKKGRSTITSRSPERRDSPVLALARRETPPPATERAFLSSRHQFYGGSGGGVALQIAIRHPEVVRKVVLASTAFKVDGWYPDVVATIRAQGVEGYANTPLPDEYRAISPRPEAWPTVVAKTREMVTSDYDWADDVAALKAPVLLLVGNGDGVRLEHAVEFFGLLGGGKGDADMRGLPPSALAVLPATTHVGWAPPFHGIMTRTQLIVPIITEFLDAPLGSGEVRDRPNYERA